VFACTGHVATELAAYWELFGTVMGESQISMFRSFSGNIWFIQVRILFSAWSGGGRQLLVPVCGGSLVTQFSLFISMVHSYYLVGPLTLSPKPCLFPQNKFLAS
jgi:hypothetical protein